MKILGRRLPLLVATAWMLFQFGATCQAQPGKTIPVEFKTEAGIVVTLSFKRIDPTPPVLTGNPDLKEQLKKAEAELKVAEEAADAAKKAADEKPENEELEKEKNDTQQAADKAATKVEDLMEKMIKFESTDGFFLLETELSQRQYAVILGKERLKEVHDRLTNEDIFSSEVIEDNKESLANDRFPVFSNTLSEVVDICRKVEEFVNNQQQNSEQLFEYRVRLPSHYEWQYACRAADPSSRPHFYQWQEYDAVKKETVVMEGDSQELEQLCNQLWERIHPNKEPFVGSQDQVYELVKELHLRAGKTAEGEGKKFKSQSLKILSFFLRGEKGIGLENDRDLSDNKAPKIEVIHTIDNKFSGNVNSWGLRHMNTNVSEWVLLVGHPENIGSDWTALVAAVSAKSLTADHTKALRKFDIGFAGAGDGDTKVWEPYTIWYVSPLKFDRNRYASSSDKKDQLALQNKGGIRLLMDVVLSDTWLISVRTIIFNEGDNAQNALAKERKNIMLFAPASEKTQVLSKLDFYGALDFLQRGENARARAEFKKTEALTAEDPYFHFLQKVIDAESP
jgi:formylglycine-generating enzyme required for sulfatase activity